MKRIFISYPFRNNPSHNFAEILEIGRKLAKLNIAYFSPITNYCALDDGDAGMREFGLKCCEEYIQYMDALFLCGEGWETSEGCLREQLTAMLELVPVYIVTGWDENGFPVFKGGNGPIWLKGATE